MPEKQWANKLCPRCKETKPGSEFGVTKSGYLRSACKSCMSAKSKAYYAKNREARIAYIKSYNAAHPEVRRASNVRWKASNTERYAVMNAEYAQAHPEGHRARESFRRAIRKGAQAEKIDHLVVFERDKGICGICNKLVDSKNWHLDHKHPLSKGGSHTYNNVQVAHPGCNLKKGARI